MFATPSSDWQMNGQPLKTTLQAYPTLHRTGLFEKLVSKQRMAMITIKLRVKHEISVGVSKIRIGFWPICT